MLYCILLMARMCCRSTGDLEPNLCSRDYISIIDRGLFSDALQERQTKSDVNLVISSSYLFLNYSVFRILTVCLKHGTMGRFVAKELLIPS